jgi:hypothetical protein
MDKDKTTRTVPLSAKREEYTVWSQRFLAYAHLKNCKKVFTGGVRVPAANETLNVTTYVDKLTAKRSDSTSYSMLIMAVTDAVSFGDVFNAQKTYLLDGDSHQALAETGDDIQANRFCKMP